MEGLLIAQVLQGLGPMPQPRGNWRFPDARTFVLPVEDRSLWILSSPPAPLLELRDGRSPAGGRGSTFQQLLQARASGELLAAEQLKLDRVLRLQFGAGAGFVSSPPVTLVVELAGRNSNLVLLDESGRILGVQREVGQGENRFRQLLPGLEYRPPPAYHKPDPRELGAAAVAELLEGHRLKDLRKLVDGIGPELSATVAVLADLPLDHVVAAADLPALGSALQELLADPQAVRRQALGSGGVAEKRSADERATLLARLEPAARKRVALLRRRLADTDKLQEASERAAGLRQQADLLLAWRPRGEPGGSVNIQDFEGNDVTVQLEPGLDAVGSAEVLYARARKHEQRYRKAGELKPSLTSELEAAEAALEALPNLPLSELRQLAGPGMQARGQHRTQPGIRVQGPHGFEIVIGRNARDNDRVTFGIARSRDIWLHVQGYRGSHVIIRAQNREVPFDTILYAARLAAGHSQAAASDNVPVDYALRKNVWRPKGAAAGAVHFSEQKTVYVTPLKTATPEEPQQV